MKAFFEGIQYLFVDILFVPMDWFREMELTNWWIANIINWIFIVVCSYWTWYWTKELKIFKDTGEDDQDTTAHSFLK
nr:uracil phosphoribosyltransferase [uncultured Flavobacterium sp.]